jgi:RNA polymerase sigma-70 factor (ECF subfamily)
MEAAVTPLTLAEPRNPAPAPAAAAQDSARRCQQIFEQNYDIIWRFVRRLGLPPDAADDVTQDVFLVVARKLASIWPGKERAFLFSTALRIASGSKRAHVRKSNMPDDRALEQIPDSTPGPDELCDQKRARENRI